MTHETDIEASSDRTESVELTASAAKRVADILADEAAGAALRVGVDGGGCSGFRYTYEVVGARAPEDLVLERGGAIVLIDPMSLEYLRGSKIDFVDDLMGQAFKIQNPQATASCGCGTSFAV
jgi:iron-sulfur cluster assembly accessory protein